MKISVIVPHYNDLEALDRCLACLQQQTLPAEDVEIIVADNASPQGEEAVAKVVANRARLVIVPQKGAGPARNGGVAVSTGEILHTFTDSDCQPESQWLANGTGATIGAYAISPVVALRCWSEIFSHMSAAESFERVFAFDAKNYVTNKGFAVTCNLFCSRPDVPDPVGGFDNVGFLRMWILVPPRALARISHHAMCADAVVGHPARRTWSELRRKWVRINAETYALMVRKPGGRIKWILICLALPFSPFVHTLKVVRSDKLYGVRDRLGALTILYGLRFWRVLDSIRLLIPTRSM